jgi:hypothetical protein
MMKGSEMKPAQRLSLAFARRGIAVSTRTIEDCLAECGAQIIMNASQAAYEHIANHAALSEKANP